MYQKLQRLFNGQLSHLYLPLLLSFIDTIGTASVYGTVYYVVLNIVNKSLTTKSLSVAIVILLSGYILRFIMVGFSQYLFQVRGAQLIREARLQLSKHLQTLPLGFFSKESIGTLINTCTVSMTQVERVITHLLGDLMKVTVVTAYIIIASFLINSKLAFIQLIIVLLTLPLLLLLGRLGKDGGERKKKAVSEVLSRVMEYIDGIRVFRAYNQTGTAFGRLNNAFKHYRDESVNLEVKLVPFNFLFFIMIDFIVPAIFIVGSYLLLSGEIEPATLIVFCLISLSVSAMYRPFSILYTEYSVLMVTINHIDSLYTMQTQSYYKTHTDFEKPLIEFKNVSFEYEAQQPVLQNVSFTLKPNTLTALIGPSGSGKSTVLHVLARFFDNQQGEVLIDGKAIKDYKPDALLQQMSIMFQRPFILNATIYENITMAKPDATMKEVERACRLANCYTFIEKLEEGFNTMVGEGGSTLSGGEKQRISLARAFLKDAPIILLDEATASLDPDNELAIKQSVNELIKGKTVIVIAHKLDTIQHADQILLMQDGKIVEQGTHGTLLQKNGRYAEMYYVQQQAKEWTIYTAQ